MKVAAQECILMILLAALAGGVCRAMGQAPCEEELPASAPNRIAQRRQTVSSGSSILGPRLTVTMHLTASAWEPPANGSLQVAPLATQKRPFCPFQ